VSSSVDCSCVFLFLSTINWNFLYFPLDLQILHPFHFDVGKIKSFIVIYKITFFFYGKYIITKPSNNSDCDSLSEATCLSPSQKRQPWFTFQYNTAVKCYLASKTQKFLSQFPFNRRVILAALYFIAQVIDTFRPEDSPFVLRYIEFKSAFQKTLSTFNWPQQLSVVFYPIHNTQWADHSTP